MFNLHLQLEQDSEYLGQLKLCQIRLINNACFPWLLLIPQQNNLVEIFDLSEAQQVLLQQEVSLIGKTLKRVTQCDKINIAALGNVVPQLHIHVIARFTTDIAWPKPVWGSITQPYTHLSSTVREWQTKLQGVLHA